MPIITKLEAAHRQLKTAIRMYFNDEDLAAIHTLVCAAREIYEKHCAAQGVDRMFEQIEAANPGRTRKQLWDILNGPRNFLKHPEASMDLSATLELDDEMNAAMLWVACHDCGMLCGESRPPEVDAYILWFLATRFPRDPPVDGHETIRAVDQAYPALRAATLYEQKRIGNGMLCTARDLAASAGLITKPTLG